MPLGAKGRKERATKAANRLAEIRRAETVDRDKDICLAFRYLSQEDLSIGTTSKAFKSLLNLKHGVKLSAEETPARFLADATGLTRQRIHQIVKKDRKLI